MLKQYEQLIMKLQNDWVFWLKDLLCKSSVAHCTANICILRIDDFCVQYSVSKTHGSVLIRAQAQLVISGNSEAWNKI